GIQRRCPTECYPVAATEGPNVLLAGTSGVTDPTNGAIGVERHAAGRTFRQAAGIHINCRCARLERGATVDRERAAIEVEIDRSEKSDIGAGTDRHRAAVKSVAEVRPAAGPATGGEGDCCAQRIGSRTQL